METCRGCGKRLTPVEGSDRHPWPRCDPRTEWLMSQAELDELAARYWPTPETPEPKEATPA